MRDIKHGNEEMGKRIKERRENLHMTQGELAEKIGYKHKSSISLIERGKTCLRIPDLFLFAKALNVEPSYIAGIDFLTED